MTQEQPRYKVVHYTEIEASEVKESGAIRTKIRRLISKDDGAPNFSMRIFEIEPEGRTPLHSHPREHEVFILEGECKVVLGEDEKIVGPGYVIYVPPNLKHTFINAGDKVLKFICVVPHRRT